ncbi:MAG: glycosyltransferase family A protein [Pyrodictiaceae archaeon]
MDKPLVSIVIPTYNSEKTLPLTLESIRRQTYRRIEVIVVDNYSSDGTAEIARRYGARVVEVHGERARAKNVGLRLADGKYVLFIDSDMELTPRVVEECVELAESNPGIAGIIIPERSVGNNYLARIRDFERSFYAGTPIESPRFFRRDLALQVGGFDEDIVFYEEATLPAKLEKLGYNVRARISSPILHHEEDLTLTKLLRKRYYYAKTARKYLEKYGSMHKDRVGIQVSPLHRYRLFLANRRFWRNPGLAVGVITLKTLEYLASLLGYLTARAGK